MSISHKLKDYFDREHVHYEILPHSEAYRAVTIAHVLDAPEREMAKVVIVKVDDRFVMTVLPASWNLDLHRLAELFAAQHVSTTPNPQGPSCGMSAPYFYCRATLP